MNITQQLIKQYIDLLQSNRSAKSNKEITLQFVKQNYSELAKLSLDEQQKIIRASGVDPQCWVSNERA